MVIPLSKTSIRMALVVILILVMTMATGLAIMSVSVFRDTVEKGFQALDSAVQRHRQVSAILETYENQIQEWENLLLRGHYEEPFYLHLNRFYDLERKTLSTARTLAEKVVDTPSLQTALDDFLRAYRRLGRKYRVAFRLYNASDTNPQFVVDELVAGHAGEPKRLLIRIKSILETERHATRSNFDAFMDHARNVSFAIGLVLMLGAVLLLFWLLNIRLVRPLDHAISVAERISAGNLDSQISINREDEIGALLMALKTMQESLVLSETEAKRFTEGLEQTVLDRTAELRAAQDEILRKERLATIGQITATVSHELRNPLGAIRSGIDAIKNLGDVASPQKNRAVALIDRAEKRCNVIITDLLDFARVHDLDRTFRAVDDWLAITLDDYALSPGMSLRRELNAGVSIDFDHERLRRVLVNVLDNACQAMGGTDDSDGEARRAEIAVTTEVAGDRLEITVSDNGPGIAPDDLERVFEPLYTTKTIGVGLGLPLVQQIMEQHGGGVEIMSEIGHGTKIVLWLPLQSSM